MLELRQPELSIVDRLLASDCRSPNVRDAVSSDYGASGFVYVICPDTESVCKIGMSTFVGGRLSGLQTGSWDELRLAAVVGVISGSMSVLERATHAILTDGGKHRRGEWFNVDEVEAVETIILAARSLDYVVDSLQGAFNRKLADNKARVAGLESDRRATMRRKLGME